MKMPWAKKTGLAKLITIFASILGISVGLCGANFAAVETISYSSASGGILYGLKEFLQVSLTITAVLEAVAILISLGSLVLLGLAYILIRLTNADHNRK